MTHPKGNGIHPRDRRRVIEITADRHLYDKTDPADMAAHIELLREELRRCCYRMRATEELVTPIAQLNADWADQRTALRTRYRTAEQLLPPEQRP